MFCWALFDIAARNEQEPLKERLRGTSRPRLTDWDKKFTPRDIRSFQRTPRRNFALRVGVIDRRQIVLKFAAAPASQSRRGCLPARTNQQHLCSASLRYSPNSCPVAPARKTNGHGAVGCYLPVDLPTATVPVMPDPGRETDPGPPTAQVTRPSAVPASRRLDRASRAVQQELWGPLGSFSRYYFGLGLLWPWHLPWP